jgi:multiphosphoryl transfer protein
VTTIELRAPLDGVIFPLEQVPDPVFAQKMVGDGLSIDPLGQLLVAPCDGTVTQLHRAHHTVTITTAEGIEVMMHIGLDTVQLKGEGFSPRVEEGQAVTAGEALIGFDADFLATHAKSLLTQVVVTNPERLAGIEPASGVVHAGQDRLMVLTLAAGTAAEETAGERVVSQAVPIPNPTGLHARPAAVLANLAKRYRSRVLLQRGDDQANAKSVVAIMGLEIGHGDKVVLIAEGVDAAEAVASLTPELAGGLGDEGTAPAPAPATTEILEDAAPAPRPRSEDPSLLLGVSASPGLAVGKVVQLRRDEILVAEVVPDLRLGEGVMHLLVGLNADQYAAEMRGAMAG